MLDSQRRKLTDELGEYISIGVTADGESETVINVPWVQTSHAFNMKIPNVYIEPSDIEDESVMALFDGRKVIGFYIFVPLEDYSFLSRFPDIRDLNIKCGDSITNLEFLRGMKECGALVLHNAALKNLDLVLDMKKADPSVIFGSFKCVALYNCAVDDLSRFEGEAHGFYEFLVFGKKDEKEKWKVVSANVYRYYETEN